ncbi:hypothetical protein [Pelagicoccus mobilis]|uniref:Uncharacterized protein n=1 Tax=Pelagicoccus mobilis TaxID=415221 RepID=A0A934RV71_9BACT|nr:hypothetical protein [Pelagicoccus mobilis]MBK1875744.1 hypothetical protein [Pelagicoccus mobilis]
MPSLPYQSSLAKLLQRKRTLLAIGTLLLVSLVTTAAHKHYNPFDHQLPTGCDEFGYLNMAKAISTGQTFADHSQRPFLPELLPALKENIRDPNHYRWMIAPHAYHLAYSEDRIINQYPPGVGLMLAALPLEQRRDAYTIACVLIGCIGLLIAAYVDAGKKLTLWPLFLIPVCGLLLHYFEASNLEFRRVGSLAPTYGLLIAAGWLMPRHPAWSLALLSFTTLFRIPNALLFPPIGLACLFLSAPHAKGIGQHLSKAIRLGIAIFASGFGMYLLYAYLRLGSPLALTYSSIDQDFTEEGGISKNLHYYFVEHRKWLWPHVFAIGLLAGSALFRSKSLKWLLFGLFVCLFNYAFYLTHKVQIEYYPYASALICIGLAIGNLELDKTPQLLRRSAAAAGILIALYSLYKAPSFPKLDSTANFQKHAAPIQQTFQEFDAIWAEHRSGTIEYVTGKAGLRYNWGPDHSRVFIIKWLRDHGYTQAIWHSDPGINPLADIEKLLQRNEIGYTKKSGPAGDYLEIASATQ